SRPRWPPRAGRSAGTTARRGSLTSSRREGRVRAARAPASAPAVRGNGAGERSKKRATRPGGDPERQQIRGELVELHLPLVEYLARRFRNRGEWLDDLPPVEALRVFKSHDRFCLEGGAPFSPSA